MHDISVHDDAAAEFDQAQTAWNNAATAWHVGHVACTIHCILYTLGVWIACREWFPLWGYAAVFLTHWPIDRWKLAAWWMKNVSGQAFFASKDHRMFPWSIVAVDNIFHLLTLWAIVKLDTNLPWLQILFGY